jgi:preprotein translocase subunit SecE
MARETKTRQPAKPGESGKGGASASAAPSPPRKPFNPLKFFTEVRQEGRKVTWTARRETVISTIMVVIMGALAALFFFLTDSVIGWVVNFVLRLGA